MFLIVLQAQSREEKEVDSYLRTVKSVVRRHNPPTGIVDHPVKWSKETDAGNVLLRINAPLGESDPSLLKVGWTRFDFIPTVPWRDVRQGELFRGPQPGLKTYHSNKIDREHERVTVTRERLRSGGGSRSGSRAGASRSRGGMGRSFSPMVRGQTPLDGTTGSYGGLEGQQQQQQQEQEQSSHVDVTVTGSDQQQQQHDGGGGPRGLNRNYSSSGSISTLQSPAAQQQHGGDFGSFRGSLPRGNSVPSMHNATSGRTKPGIPSATVPRRSFMSRPIPEEFLETLSPRQLKVPLHPAYLLDSSVHHEQPWRKGEKKPRIFSNPARGKATTQNDANRAQRFIVPDRVYYEPKEDGKVPWLKPMPGPYPIFSRVPLDSEWLEIHERQEGMEREARFYEAAESGAGMDVGMGIDGGGQYGDGTGGGYQGEDAFDNANTRGRASMRGSQSVSGVDGAQISSSVTGGPNSMLARLNRLAATGGAAGAAKAAARSLSPALQKRLEYEEKKAELINRHLLGRKAFEAAEQEAQHALVSVTMRMKGKLAMESSARPVNSREATSAASRVLGSAGAAITGGNRR